MNLFSEVQQMISNSAFSFADPAFRLSRQAGRTVVLSSLSFSSPNIKECPPDRMPLCINLVFILMPFSLAVLLRSIPFMSQ
jgi:hypothetical protein